MALRTPEILDTKQYTFAKVRNMLADLPIQEGIVRAADLAVTAVGGNMNLNIAAGVGWVQGDSVAYQGLYHVVNDAAMVVTVPAAHATLPRIDQLVLHVYDSTVSGTSDVPALEIVQGTATAGATLSNDVGRAALPANCLRLCDVQVDAAVTSLSAAKLRDRRPSSRGVKSQRVDSTTTYSAAGTNIAGGAKGVPLNAQRVELSGAPVWITLGGGRMYIGANAPIYGLYHGFRYTGPSQTVPTDGVAALVNAFRAGTADDINVVPPFSKRTLWTPPAGAGSYFIEHFVKADLGLTTTTQSVQGPFELTIEEIITGEFDNGTT